MADGVYLFDIRMHNRCMPKRENPLEALKALARKPPTRPRAFRVPIPIDDEILRLSKETGASYTDTILFVIQLGLDTLKGKK